MSIHEGHRQRMRRQLKTSGMDSLSDVQVLEVLLYYAIPRADTNPIAHRLLERFGSLSGVLEAAPGSGVRWITPEDYYLKEGLLRRWQYQPACCSSRCIETDFQLTGQFSRE
mgnify:CR=1 FL=1